MSDESIERHKYLLELMERCIEFLEEYPPDFIPVNSQQDSMSGDTPEDSMTNRIDAPDQIKNGDNFDRSRHQSDFKKDSSGIGELVDSLKMITDMTKPKISDDDMHHLFERVSSKWPDDMFPTYLGCARVIGSAMHEAAYYHPELALERAFDRYSKN